MLDVHYVLNPSYGTMEYRYARGETYSSLRHDGANTPRGRVLGLK